MKTTTLNRAGQSRVESVGNLLVPAGAAASHKFAGGADHRSSPRSALVPYPPMADGRIPR